MEAKRLPPKQHWISSILRWNIDHPGINPANPKFDPRTWILAVDGEVRNPLRLGWEDFLKLPSVESKSDFHCVEGWSVRECSWFGVRFGSLVEIVKPHEEAKSAFFSCSDGYTTSLELEELLSEDVLLAYKLNGEYLSEPLGGPLRLIAPDTYAYKSAMWLKQITFMKIKELGYWEKRGYSDTADVWNNDRYAGQHSI